MVRAGNLAAWLLHQRSIEAAKVEDTNERGFTIALVDIGVPGDWSPRFAETVGEMDVNRRRVIGNFRYYVVMVARNQVSFIHSPFVGVAAGVFDRMAGMYGCEGHASGYRAFDDRSIVAKGQR